MNCHYRNKILYWVLSLYAHVCTCKGLSLPTRCLPLLLSSCFDRPVSPWDPPASLYLPVLGLQACTATSGLYMGTGGLDADPHEPYPLNHLPLYEAF